MKKFLAITLLLVFALAISAEAFAATSVSSITFKTNVYGGHKSTFYVKTDNILLRNLKFTMTQGKFVLENFESIGTQASYGYYEVKTYYKDGSKWVLEKDYDIKNSSSNTLSFKKNKATYKVEIWHWASGTACQSYINSHAKFAGWSTNDPVTGIYGSVGKAYGKWATQPKITAAPIWGQGCTLYKTAP